MQDDPGLMNARTNAMSTAQLAAHQKAQEAERSAQASQSTSQRHTATADQIAANLVSRGHSLADYAPGASRLPAAPTHEQARLGTANAEPRATAAAAAGADSSATRPPAAAAAAAGAAGSATMDADATQQLKQRLHELSRKAKLVRSFTCSVHSPHCRQLLYGCERLSPPRRLHVSLPPSRIGARGFTAASHCLPNFCSMQTDDEAKEVRDLASNAGMSTLLNKAAITRGQLCRDTEPAHLPAQARRQGDILAAGKKVCLQCMHNKPCAA